MFPRTAQEESNTISQNTKMGISYRFQEGKIIVNHNKFLGYTKNDEGELVIVPEEAEVVRRIFREFLEDLPGVRGKIRSMSGFVSIIR